MHRLGRNGEEKSSKNWQTQVYLERATKNGACVFVSVTIRLITKKTGNEEI